MPNAKSRSGFRSSNGGRSLAHSPWRHVHDYHGLTGKPVCARDTRMFFALIAATIISAATSAEGSEFYSNGDNFVYRETQSCALYIDLPQGAMIRLSYRDYSGQVFFSIVGGPWNEIEVGAKHMLSVATDKTGLTSHVFLAEGIIQPGDDVRRGLAGEQGLELLTLFRSASTLTVSLDNDTRTTYQLSGMDVATDKLRTCSRAYFNVPPLRS